jgi:hypothetical protein
MRVGSLGRDKPIFLLIETPRHDFLARMRDGVVKCEGGSGAVVSLRQEGRRPWRAENPREDRLRSCG